MSGDPKNIKANAQRWLHEKYPRSFTFQIDFEPSFGIPPVHGVLAIDLESGVGHPLLAISGLGGNGASELPLLAMLPAALLEKSKEIQIEAQIPKKQKRYSKNIILSPMLTLYTDKLSADVGYLNQKFDEVGMAIDVVSEDELHQSAFISYGGPDEKFVEKINNYLVAKGVKTWFFPKDKLPGQKLHRMMFEGVNNHDRVLLVCSKAALSRPGVLNEIERVLEREATEGGSDILIPLSIDGYLFSDEFRPQRSDIAAQIKARVVATIPDPETDAPGFEREMTSVLRALKKAGA